MTHVVNFIPPTMAIEAQGQTERGGGGHMMTCHIFNQTAFLKRLWHYVNNAQ